MEFASSVEEAVREELTELAQAAPAVAASYDAAIALSLAKDLDGAGNVSAKTTAQRGLAETMARLRARANGERGSEDGDADVVSDLGARRAKRRHGLAGT